MKALVLGMGLSLGLVLSGNAADSDSESRPHAPVGKEIQAILDSRLNIKVNQMKLSDTLAWYRKLTENPITVEVSAKAADLRVSLDLVDATWAEALRLIKKQTGADYRIVDGRVRIAMPDEFKGIDAGKETFKAAEIPQ